jgi:hypothetical protein
VIDTTRPGPGSAGSMNMIYPGDTRLKVPFAIRPISNAITEQQRRMADLQAPVVIVDGSAAAAGVENGAFPWLTIPHRVLSYGDGFSVSFPGGNFETAHYAAAALGQAAKVDDVLVHLTSSRAPNIAGIKFATDGLPMDQPTIEAVTGALRSIGAPFVIGPVGQYVAVVHPNGANPAILAGSVRAVRALGLEDLNAEAYRGDVERIASADFGRVLAELGHRYGDRGRPDLSESARDPGPEVAASPDAERGNGGATAGLGPTSGGGPEGETGPSAQVGEAPWDQSTSPERFIELRNRNPLAAFMSPITAADLEGRRTFVRGLGGAWLQRLRTQSRRRHPERFQCRRAAWDEGARGRRRRDTVGVGRGRHDPRTPTTTTCPITTTNSVSRRPGGYTSIPPTPQRPGTRKGSTIRTSS